MRRGLHVPGKIMAELVAMLAWPPGFNPRRVISSFSLIHGADLLVWALVPGYGLHPLGAEECGVPEAALGWKARWASCMTPPMCLARQAV